jgi:hypothetical protein
MSSRHVTNESHGSSGTVTYHEAGKRLICHWEFGGTDAVVIVQCGSNWTPHPWAADRRVGPGPHCSFHYSTVSGTVLAAGMPDDTRRAPAVMKFHGRLVEAVATYAEPAPTRGLTVAADGVYLVIAPYGDDHTKTSQGMVVRDARARLDLADAGISIGYGGFFGCGNDEAPTASLSD